MDFRAEDIKACIAAIPFVRQIYKFDGRETRVLAKLEIAFDGLDGSLDFDVIIIKPYPLKSHDSEAIYFINRELMMYNHVMSDGHICIHTSHCTDLEEKIKIDFEALKNWIVKYYINKETDQKYEHMVLEPSVVNDRYYSYFFTDCSASFIKGESGLVDLSKLKEGIYKDKITESYYVQKFTSNQDIKKECEWSNIYSERKIADVGFYYFLEDAPATYGKFAYKYWNEIETLIAKEYIEFLYTTEKDFLKKKLNGGIMPLFLGYKIGSADIHWQVAILTIGSFPLMGVAEKVNGIKTGNWKTQLTDDPIAWAFSKNTSYHYFFGRGTFSEQLTQKKILIIGLGAIGSMIGATLTRGGCRHIDFVDYDIKEPENVCRSEYTFANGIGSKRDELERIVTEISPFVNTRVLNNEYFEAQIKGLYADPKLKSKFNDEINNYDIIFDCTTDNDLMYVLNQLGLTSQLINISITNHANELVCAFSPNIYRFVNNQFSNVLKNDTVDLYEPTGCWSPTFKASYNDISSLVQLALKRINNIFDRSQARNNFVITALDGNLKIDEF